MIRYFAAILVLELGLVTQLLAAPHSISPERIDAAAAKTLERFNIPGLAIAVVQPGAPDYLRGYGVAEINQQNPVQADTLFGIGSVSKAFTTTGLAQFVAAGKLRWDDRVIDHIPEFRMADPWVTREFRVADLVSHRSGLAPYAGDLIILTESKANRHQIYRALARLQPATSFRSEFAYDNLLYVVAGDLLERLSGQRWGDYINTHILQPLGMKRCVPGYSEVPRNASRSSAHELVDGELKVVDFPLPPVVQAAGGIYCDAQGMARWIQFNLGRHGGQPILDASNLGLLHSPTTIMPVGAYGTGGDGSSFAAYGLGWFLQDSFGILQVQHAGGLPGMVSYLSLFPGEGIGIMVMSNRSSTAARALAAQLAEYAFADEPEDLIAAAAARELEAIESAARVIDAGLDRPEKTDKRPSLPLDDYAGSYDDAWFGKVEVTHTPEGLVLDMGSTDLTAVLDHLDGDRFIARWSNRALAADAYISFQQTAAGSVRSATMQAVSPRTDPSYNFHDLKLERMNP